jgi:hypothetical protein
MSFWKRLQLYGVGFIIGLIILIIINKNKKCSSPNEIKIEELANQHIAWNPKLDCRLKCLGLDSAQFKNLINNCRVNYERSDVHAEPYGKYTLESKTKDKVMFTLLIIDKGNLSLIDELQESPAADCNCPK